MIRFLPFEENSLVGMKAFENDNELGFCTFSLDGYKMFFEI